MALVLVVDDAQDARHLLSGWLTRSGHATVIASNAEDALRAVGDFNPQVVILDVDLPGLDGIELLKLLPRNEAGQLTPPVVMVTGVEDEHTRAQSEALGASGYFVKGQFEHADLLARIGQLVR